MVSARRSKFTIARALRQELVSDATAYTHPLTTRIQHEQHLRATRPILTGALMSPSASNPPLPRMRRQPRALSLMIAKRRRATAHRIEISQPAVAEARRLLIAEATFERDLLRMGERFAAEFHGQMNGWSVALDAWTASIQAAFERENERARLPFPEEVLEAARQARKRKLAYRTERKMRERAGEVLPSTLERRRKAPPAHVLARMSEREKREDAAMRSLSEVGYVGMLKARYGRRMRDEARWKAMEEGEEERRQALDKAEDEIRVENLRRRLENV